MHNFKCIIFKSYAKRLDTNLGYIWHIILTEAGLNFKFNRFIHCKFVNCNMFVHVFIITMYTLHMVQLVLNLCSAKWTYMNARLEVNSYKIKYIFIFTNNCLEHFDVQDPS